MEAFIQLDTQPTSNNFMIFYYIRYVQVYVDCFELLFSDNNHHLSLTLLTAAVERSLGDVSKTRQPLLIKQ